MTDKARQHQQALWDSIHDYVRACGGDPTKPNHPAAQTAVVAVERAASLFTEFYRQRLFVCTDPSCAIKHFTVRSVRPREFADCPLCKKRCEPEESILTKLQKLRDQLNAVYNERDRCVALVAALAQIAGYNAWLGHHDDMDADWDPEWRHIAFIELPTGQTSWHIHDSELPLFAFLQPRNDLSWDGHTTTEKYDRMERFCLPALGPGAALDATESTREKD